MPNVSKKLKKSADSEKNRPIPDYFSKKSILHITTIYAVGGHNLMKIEHPDSPGITQHRPTPNAQIFRLFCPFLLVKQHLFSKRDRTKLLTTIQQSSIESL